MAIVLTVLYEGLNATNPAQVVPVTFTLDCTDFSFVEQKIK